MFGFGPPVLDLLLNDIEVKFNSPADFEFALGGRTSLPSDKISRLVGMSDDDLLREAEGIRKLEKRFSEILSSAMQSTTKLGPILKALDMSLVTQDNDWRAIIETLNGADDKFEEHKRLALVKYMQYLQARQDVIRTLYGHRKENAKEAAGALETRGQKMRETLIFDQSEEAGVGVGVGVGDGGEGMRRLPKGEAVEFKVSSDQPLLVKIVRHECTISDDGGLTFTDEVNNSTPLIKGRYAVGRDAECEILLDSGYRDISRQHVIIDVDGDMRVWLTDVSSLGTFVPQASVSDAEV